jgi:transcriptional regulator with XRE-family HTH domain
MATGHILTGSIGLGPLLRTLREDRDLPLWRVAHAARMDSTLLSKIELSQRLPTRDQLSALAKYFGADGVDLEGIRMAEKFLQENGHDLAAAALAAARISDAASVFLVNTKRTTVSYRRSAVNKSKKKV